MIARSFCVFIFQGQWAWKADLTGRCACEYDYDFVDDRCVLSGGIVKTILIIFAVIVILIVVGCCIVKMFK